MVFGPTINIPELMATYMKVWLEDNLPSELLDIMENDKGAYSSENKKAILSEVYFGLVENRLS
jgi:hypothetical protein